MQIFGTLFGTPLSVDTGRDDASGIACTLATGEKTLKTDVHQRVRLANNADGR